MKTKDLVKKFAEIYGYSDNNQIGKYFAPGRINLIGEHTDYNGGLVLPCGLNFGTYLLIRKNPNPEIRLTSLNFPGQFSIPVDMIEIAMENDWFSYPLGLLNLFLVDGKSICGLDLLYYGEIPNGAGLSSSASIEMVTAYALNDIFSWNYSMKELALLSQKCEHDFIGTNCGIMDQYAVTFAQKNHAMFLNCLTLKFTMVPFNIDGYKMIISNTNKRRELNESKYNERVSECNTALNSIQKHYEIESLGELSLESFRELEHYIQHPVRRKRVYHVVNENYRVLEAVKALELNDIRKFGKLMYASHNSLKDYYEVTGFELDTLVNEAGKIDGVIGSRMTGAGFGGCTISLVEQSQTEMFISKLGAAYKETTGLEASFYIAETGDGVC